MIATPHMLVGALLGELIHNYPLAFLAGFLSHFLLDAIPHLESSTFVPVEKRKKVNLFTPKVIIFEVFEVLVGAALVIYLYIISSYNLAIIFGALGTILPDWDKYPFIGKKLKNVVGFKQFHRFHSLCHNELKPQGWIWGLLIYIILIGIVVWVFSALS